MPFYTPPPAKMPLVAQGPRYPSVMTALSHVCHPAPGPAQPAESLGDLGRSLFLGATSRGGCLTLLSGCHQGPSGTPSARAICFLLGPWQMRFRKETGEQWPSRVREEVHRGPMPSLEGWGGEGWGGWDPRALRASGAHTHSPHTPVKSSWGPLYRGGYCSTERVADFLEGTQQ